MKLLKNTTAQIIFFGIILFTSHLHAQNPEIEKMHQQYITMINTGNSGLLDALYAEDATIRNSDGSMVSGFDNIKAQYEATFASGKFNITLKTTNTTKLSKDFMFVSGMYVYNKIDEPKMTLKGEFVNTLKQVKGNWKLFKSYRYTETTNNSQIINGLYESFSKEDVPAVLALMDDKIVWNEAESNALAVGNPYIGPDAVLNGVFAPIGGMYQSFALKDVKLHEMSNDKVLATLYYDLNTKEGKAFMVQAAHLWTLKDGKIVGFQQYADTKKLAETVAK